MQDLIAWLRRRSVRARTAYTQGNVTVLLRHRASRKTARSLLALLTRLCPQGARLRLSRRQVQTLLRLESLPRPPHAPDAKEKP